MVKFFLVSTVDNIATYEYYPEGNKSKECGIIALDIVSGKTTLVKKAEDDWSHIITSKSMNESRTAINRMREEIGKEPLQEEEFPVATEDYLYFYYAFHAIKRIEEYFMKGEVSKGGTVAWY